MFKVFKQTFTMYIL